MLTDFVFVAENCYYRNHTARRVGSWTPSSILPKNGRNQSKVRSSLTPRKADQVHCLPMDALTSYHKQLQTTQLFSNSSVGSCQSGG